MANGRQVGGPTRSPNSSNGPSSTVGADMRSTSGRRHAHRARLDLMTTAFIGSLTVTPGSDPVRVRHSGNSRRRGAIGEAAAPHPGAWPQSFLAVDDTHHFGTVFGMATR